MTVRRKKLLPFWLKEEDPISGGEGAGCRQIQNFDPEFFKAEGGENFWGDTVGNSAQPARAVSVKL